jgi:hypothetical protein
MNVGLERKMEDVGQYNIEISVDYMTDPNRGPTDYDRNMLTITLRSSLASPRMLYCMNVLRFWCEKFLASKRSITDWLHLPSRN